jgi:hypothetical protein
MGTTQDEKEFEESYGIARAAILRERRMLVSEILDTVHEAYEQIGERFPLLTLAPEARLGLAVRITASIELGDDLACMRAELGDVRQALDDLLQVETTGWRLRR